MDVSICHFKGVRYIWLLLFYFRWTILLTNKVDLDQTPHDVASHLGVHYLPYDTFNGFPGKNGLIVYFAQIHFSEQKYINMRKW